MTDRINQPAALSLPFTSPAISASKNVYEKLFLNLTGCPHFLLFLSLHYFYPKIQKLDKLFIRSEFLRFQRKKPQRYSAVCNDMYQPDR